jgi:hypothetical protein
MSNHLPEDVERFIGYFKDQIEEVRVLNTKHAELYRRILYASILDTLAGTVLPRRPNRDRFVYFVRRFCQWPDGERVSLPHLVQLIKRNPDPAFEKLREWALSAYRGLPVHGESLMPISHDPAFNEVQSKWPSSREHRTPLEGVDLVSLQHIELLYAYRNTLVHEFRTPGYGMEFANDENPFYHHMSHIEDDSPNEDDRLLRGTAELVYPWRFLHGLCDTALQQLKTYLLTNELNPYDARVFGTYWIRELNR